MRRAVYVRVSTQRQAHLQTIEQQLERLQAHFQEQEWEWAEDLVFRDDGYSGASLKRPGLDRLREQAAQARLDRVVITAPDPDWLKDFSRKLVEQRLCASAHIFAPVQSVYRWRGDIYERTEGRVSLHTRRDRVAMIVALAKQEHPYEVPGISTRTITDGNPDYLAWIAQETAP